MYLYNVSQFLLLDLMIGNLYTKLEKSKHMEEKSMGNNVEKF